MTACESVDGPTAQVRALAVTPSGNGRDALRAQVIESLLPLSDRLARRYRGLGVPLEDLRQVAATGLIKSVDGYQPAIGAFVSYAVPTITGELRRYLRDRAWAVRPPRQLQELALHVHHAAEAVWAQRGDLPTMAELAEMVSRPVDDVRRALAAFRAYMAVSLDSASRPDDPAPLAEVLPAADSGIDAIVDRLALATAVTTLPERERKIIRMRFLDDLTQQEIAAALGISQAHVSGILSRTLSTLRRALSAEGGETPEAEAARTPPPRASCGRARRSGRQPRAGSLRPPCRRRPG